MINRGWYRLNNNDEYRSEFIPQLPPASRGLRHRNSERKSDRKSNHLREKSHLYGDRRLLRNDLRDRVSVAVFVGSAEVSLCKLAEILRDLNRCRILQSELLQRDIDLCLGHLLIVVKISLDRHFAEQKQDNGDDDTQGDE